MGDSAVYHMAWLMIRTHGKQAEARAAIRMGRLLDSGDEAGQKAWRNVLLAIDELNCAERPSGAPVH